MQSGHHGAYQVLSQVLEVGLVVGGNDGWDTTQGLDSRELSLDSLQVWNLRRLRHAGPRKG